MVYTFLGYLRTETLSDRGIVANPDERKLIRSNPEEGRRETDLQWLEMQEGTAEPCSNSSFCYLPSHDCPKVELPCPVAPSLCPSSERERQREERTGRLVVVNCIGRTVVGEFVVGLELIYIYTYK